VFALSLAPIAATAHYPDVSALHEWTAFAAAAIVAASQGAAVGLCATIAAGAAAAAGGLIDAAVASQPGPARDVFGESGPVGLLCSSLFGWLFFGGAFDKLAAVCITADDKTIGVSAIAALAGACAQTALAVAGPAIAAQAFAAIIAAGIARMAPRVNGMFLGAPIAATLVIASLIAGGGMLIGALADIARRAAAASDVLH
jgi:type III secretory pathway component EscT